MIHQRAGGIGSRLPFKPVEPPYSIQGRLRLWKSWGGAGIPRRPWLTRGDERGGPAATPGRGLETIPAPTRGSPFRSPYFTPEMVKSETFTRRTSSLNCCFNAFFMVFSDFLIPAVPLTSLTFMERKTS